MVPRGKWKRNRRTSRAGDWREEVTEEKAHINKLEGNLTHPMVRGILCS